VLRRATNPRRPGFRQVLRLNRTREGCAMDRNDDKSFPRFLECATRFLFFTGKGGVDEG